MRSRFSSFELRRKLIKSIGLGLLLSSLPLKGLGGSAWVQCPRDSGAPKTVSRQVDQPNPRRRYELCHCEFAHMGIRSGIHRQRGFMRRRFPRFKFVEWLPGAQFRSLLAYGFEVGRFGYPGSLTSASILGVRVCKSAAQVAHFKGLPSKQTVKSNPIRLQPRNPRPQGHLAVQLETQGF